ncbi:Predicted 3-hydroxylacyl-ACP dehydratase, HotDog domain [Marinobacter persicus]|uniref:Predicted 3-hydroxylacyl-ACP dehydratase, HotDog domain n=1 Tax=Marinobacter persicus TaxID=930118 RepID=A0A1I3WP64_9GAMM|nr:hypothetical protein [Marinobacter persicus]GHD48049.1 3-hydroxydecanoyl-ACP dehydratase [Marinobacter persicus]SFK09160.1 Predicted 3-hydroxylacyl-ACP dehydratase, HotDog domain [Marinobacter persicus]
MSADARDYPSVEQLVPHRGGMSLLDAITGLGDDWLEARARITAESLFQSDGQVPAWVGLEYLAQAAAAFMGAVNGQGAGAARIGFLTGSRRYQSERPAFKVGSVLTLRVERIGVADNGLAMFEGSLVCHPPQGQAFDARGRLTVYEPDDSTQFYGEQP